jgi:hypothetical protein
MSGFNAYVQQADDFITKQIHKFEQQKRGNRSPPRALGYTPMPVPEMSYGPPPPHGGYPGQGYPGQGYHSPAPSQYGAHPPPQGPDAPQGWAQEWDPQNQRWYYIERATGRSQWEPPAYPPRAQTFQDRSVPYNNDQQWRARSGSQPQRPISSNGRPMSSGSQWSNSNGGNASPHPNLQQQKLPPGSYYDMKTGKVVSSMFPEGHTAQSWQQEIQRL